MSTVQETAQRMMNTPGAYDIYESMERLFAKNCTSNNGSGCGCRRVEVVMHLATMQALRNR